MESLRIEEIYQEILNGKRKSFPYGTWVDKDMAVRCTRYLFDEVLQWTEEDIKKKANATTFKKYNLGGMLQNVFNLSPYDAINSAYPNQFHPWEMMNTPKNFWNSDTTKLAIKWLIEEKLIWSDEDIKMCLSFDTFNKNYLGGMLNNFFDGSVYLAMEATYPHKYKPWEFKKTPQSFWTKETGVESIKWLIEEKLKWNKEEVKQKINTKVFDEQGLAGMLVVVFQNSVVDAIQTSYPNEYKPWEFAKAKNNYWNPATAKEATKWLFEEKLNLSEDKIKKDFSKNMFRKYGLEGMLKQVFNGNTQDAMRNAYPEIF